jgi:hypothetical protein
MTVRNPGALATEVQDNGPLIGMAVAGGIALVAAVIAGVALGTSIVHTERAGQVLSGQAQEGCTEGQTLPTSFMTPSAFEMPSAEPPRAPVRRPAGHANGPQCSEADLAEMKAAGLSESAITSACTK